MFVSHLHHLCPSLKRCRPGSETLHNAFQTTWTPVPPATALILHSAMSLDVEHRECLPWSATPLLFATSLDLECWRHLPWSATALTPSALPCHPTSSIEDAPGLPSPSSLPHHLTSSIENASPHLLLPYQKPFILCLFIVLYYADTISFKSLLFSIVLFFYCLNVFNYYKLKLNCYFIYLNFEKWLK